MAKKIRNAVRSFFDRTIERILNIDTFLERDEFSDATARKDRNEYEALSYLTLYYMLKPLGLSSGDTVFDIGSGQGRMLCFVGLREVKRCIGIEFVPELIKAAQTNATTMRFRQAPIQFFCRDATTAEYAEGTVYLLFNPFGEETLRIVLQRIKESLDELPRTIRVAYVNPVHESVLKECGWLRCTGRRRPGLSRLYASYWINDNILARQ